ncbi:MAG: class I SAM-dependent methyltransferase [Planctomycetota bacterium]|nr:class I SAM-dependent methyltransferase [Planctomycetota bacterium]
MQPELFKLHAQVEETHWWFTARRQIMCQMLHQALPPDPDRVVVDVGCGTGANIAALAQDYNCVGIDTTPDAILYARERFGGVSFIEGQAPKDLGPVFRRMDAVLLMDVLEHVEDDRGLLGAQVKAMKPGGIVLITVPADMKLWSEHDVSFGHYRRYDLEMLRAIWHDLPLDELMCSYFNSRLYPIIRMIRALNRLRGRAWGQAGSDLSLPSRPVNRMLERIFAGESYRLLNMLESSTGRKGNPYGYGVSLIALLRKNED